MKRGRREGQKGAMPTLENGKVMYHAYMTFQHADFPEVYELLIECSKESGKGSREILRALALMLKQKPLESKVDEILSIVKNGIMVNAEGHTEIKPDAQHDLIKAAQQEFLS